MTLKEYPIFGIPLVKHQIIATASLATLATCMVVLRFVTRCFRRQKVWWDDGWILLALVSTSKVKDDDLADIYRSSYTVSTLYWCTVLKLTISVMQAFQIAFARYGIRHSGYEIPIENGLLLGKVRASPNLSRRCQQSSAYPHGSIRLLLLRCHDQAIVPLLLLAHLSTDSIPPLGHCLLRSYLALVGGVHNASVPHMPARQCKLGYQSPK